jgi:hypothetical protein
MFLAFCSCESVHAFMLVLQASFGVLITMHEQLAYAHECFHLFRVVNTLPALNLKGRKLLRGTLAPKDDALFQLHSPPNPVCVGWFENLQLLNMYQS